jgi:DNA-binding transcriptional regulator GbsR (MarR family)
MALTPVMEKFILHWGEMGTRWGVNRTVAQVHALLYILGRPLNAEEIADTLAVARSNVSTSLRELQGWGLVRIVHVMGDRRDHFETFDDVWQMFEIVMDERKKREIDPTIAMLRQCVADAGRARDPGTAAARKRLEAMLDFFQTTSSWYDQVRRLPRGAVLRMLKLGGRLRRVLGLAA